MKIGIIGGGSIGLLFAFYLSKQYSVCLYVRTVKQMEAIKSYGLRLERTGEVWKQDIDIKLCPEWRGLEDVTIISVKQYHLPNIIEMLTQYSRSDHTLLFLQNGMGHLKWLDDLKGYLYVGTVEHGAMRTADNVVHHTGMGSTKLAPYRERNTEFHYWMTNQDEFFPFEFENQYENMLLKKLVVNAVINPLTAILKVPNGELITNPHYYLLVQLLFREIEQSLQLQNSTGYFENVISVCGKTAKNHSSMLRDLEENRPTEVDAILGYILEKATEREIDTPIIKCLYYAVKGKECNVEG